MTTISSSARPLGLLSGGAHSVPTYVDNGGGSVTVHAIDVTLYSDPYFLTVPAKYRLAEITETLTDGVLNYVVGDYNSGTPILKVITDVSLITESNVIPILTIFCDAGDCEVQGWDTLGFGLANKLHQSIVKTERYRRESGLALSEYGTRNVLLSAGVMWVAAVKYTLGEVASATANMHYYARTAGNWVLSSVTQYNNTEYSDGTNTQTLTNNHYAVNWLYRSVCDSLDLYMVLGTGDYNLHQAQASQPPANLPSRITSHAVLVGRIIVKKGDPTATQVDSAYSTVFTAAAASLHNDLSGLQGGIAGEYYHLSSAQHTVSTQAATSLVSGYLTSTDWSTFNGKQDALTLGNITGSGAIGVSGGTGAIIGSGVTVSLTQASIDHGSIGGLSDDDHTQYALLAGRVGNQSLIGGTAASGTLTLQSTANATKGKILFGTSGYDEVNNRLGLGTASPAVRLDAVATAAASAAETIAKFSVSDDATGKLEILNHSTTNSAFTPKIKGTGSSNRNALVIAAAITSDTGTEPAIMIDAPSTSTRPGFHYMAGGNTYFTIGPASSLAPRFGFGLAASTPTALMDIHVDTVMSTLANWGTKGLVFSTLFDAPLNQTSYSAGAIAALVGHSFGAWTLDSTFTVTYTDVANVYIAGPPTAGTGATITNPYALWVDAGKCRFDEAVGIGTGAPNDTLDVLGTARFGDHTTNYSKFESDGTLTMAGTATVWKDINLGGVALRVGGTAPTFAAFMNGVYAYRFDDATASECHGQLELQHDYKEGTALSFHIHWAPTTTNTGNIRWGLEYTIASKDETYPATSTIYVTQAGAGVANRMQTIAFADISGTGVTISDIIAFRLFRDGANVADTFTGNAFLLSCGIHYELDTLGSRQITTK